MLRYLKAVRQMKEIIEDNDLVSLLTCDSQRAWDHS